LDPTNIDCLQNLSWLAAQSGQLDAAVAWLEEISHLRPEQFDVIRDMARLEAQSGKIDRAASRLVKFVSENPDNLQANLGLAQFFLSVEADAAQAIDYAQRAVGLHASAANYALLASCQEAAGRLSDAVHAIERAVELDPTNTRYRQAQNLLRTRLALIQEASPGSNHP
jgi:tetratricopeptide (TPR) repeat protein